ncbi:hypothetical protein Pan216_06050 [Planctomycetes bacterium Pan216]|uniref:Glycosyltransferase RgtA/B/C/D-like domain-containing protein n=1 Tax=Kolteria novifilia TaxID=2527975 RepID=A0A518AYH8_9BACT|nr:hypothetical protein Pan216_06050 [Planctomycetes bacterium Pan216]
MRTRYFASEVLVFLGFWLFLLVAGREKLLSDPGSLWHPVVGGLMLDSGHLVTADPFSFTQGGERWIAMQWLAECFLGLLDRLGGLDSILTATAALLALLNAWIYHRLRRAGASWLLAIGFTILVFSTSAHHFHARPHVFSLLFLGATMALLLDVDAGRASPRRCWLLLPLFVLWTNLHPAVLGGIGTLGLAAIGWSLVYLFRRPIATPVESGAGIVELALLCGAALLTPLVNPFGVELPRVWFSLQGSDVLSELIVEHAPIYRSPLNALLFLVLAGVYFYFLLGVERCRLRVTWLIPLVWILLAIGSQRHGALFAVTVGFAIAEILPSHRLVVGADPESMFALDPVEQRTRLAAWRLAIVPLLVVGTCLAWQGLGVRAPIVGRGWARPDGSKAPMELLPKLREIVAEHGEGMPIYNDLGLGGFVIRYLPGARVFIDDRCEFYGDEGLQHYVAGRKEMAQFKDWADRYGFVHALVEPASKLDRLLTDSPDWKLLQRAPAAALYRRVDSEGASKE